jgi:hypothetical protein
MGANCAGTAGVDWDLISASGGITVDATASDPFIVVVTGSPTNFNHTLPGRGSSWMAPGRWTGFARNRFLVDTTGFTADMQGGSLIVNEQDGDLYIAVRRSGHLDPGL